MVAGVARKNIDERARIEFFKILGKRFLIVSGLALATLIASGTYMADQQLSSFSQLSDTAWGRILREKLGLVAFVIVLVVVHSFVVAPALRKTRERLILKPDDQALGGKLRHLQAISGILNLVLLLAALGVLVMAAKLGTS